MAQITYTKLGIKPVVDEVKIIDWAPEIKIEVRQYLPLQKKLEVLTNIINASTDDNGFYNSAKIDFNQTLEIIFAYTNIKFTDKQKEDPMKLYDSFYSNGLAEKIFELIPSSELKWFDKHVRISIDKIYEYRNSAYGILDALKNDYDGMNIDVDKIRQALASDDNIEVLKEVMDKMV